MPPPETKPRKPRKRKEYTDVDLAFKEIERKGRILPAGTSGRTEGSIQNLARKTKLARATEAKDTKAENRIKNAQYNRAVRRIQKEGMRDEPKPSCFAVIGSRKLAPAGCMIRNVERPDGKTEKYDKHGNLIKFSGEHRKYPGVFVTTLEVRGVRAASGAFSNIDPVKIVFRVGAGSAVADADGSITMATREKLDLEDADADADGLYEIEFRVPAKDVSDMRARMRIGEHNVITSGLAEQLHIRPISKNEGGQQFIVAP